ncbi:MAG: hypothetical protein K6G33_01090 [Ruminococcus sp.]|uniref:hypothetical protein n=1 Tax=Ruminococcus sp. TaxID=41978 RepID=UPI0025FD436E|nr:hypothetical protein [Ruminococcus sp.]MCR5599328.1 hypothetical protein [Ruminococcus sp.]
MASCRIVKASVEQSVTNLNNYAKQYEEAGNTFATAFKNAIADMEGAAKDALLEFFETKIEGFVTKDLPSAVTGLASLLSTNLQQFDDVDGKLAESIKGDG